MDPLSITAGIATLATLTAQLGVRFQKLRETCAELPGRIHALNDEVADLEVVLIQLSSVIQERNCFTENDGLTMDHLMLQAREKLEEINTIIERLTAVCCRKTLVPRASLWRKLHPKLQSLQEEIKVIKSSLIMLLGASNSYAFPLVLLQDSSTFNS